MATHSRILAWRILWTEEPSRLQSMGSQRVRHDWATNVHTHTHTHICIFIIGTVLNKPGWLITLPPGIPIALFSLRLSCFDLSSLSYPLQWADSKMIVPPGFTLRHREPANTLAHDRKFRGKISTKENWKKYYPEIPIFKSVFFLFFFFHLSAFQCCHTLSSFMAVFCFVLFFPT